MNQARILYQLQEAELRIRKHTQRIAEIDAQLQNNTAIQQAQAAVDAAEEKLHPLQTQQRDLELQVQSTSQKRQQTETRLYSGSVTNPKELQDMQNEIESLKRRRDDLDFKLLVVMEEIEGVSATLQQVEEQLNHTQEIVAAENKDAVTEKEGLQSEVAEAQSERETLLEQVEAENLQRYERLKPQTRNRPVSRLVSDDMCEACGIQQIGTYAREIRQSKEILTCRNCRRMLVYIG